MDIGIGVRSVSCEVGLPARGKSYLAKMLQRYLAWLGFPVRTFNAGDFRRRRNPPSSGWRCAAMDAPLTMALHPKGHMLEQLRFGMLRLTPDMVHQRLRIPSRQSLVLSPLVCSRCMASSRIELARVCRVALRLVMSVPDRIMWHHVRSVAM